MVAVIKTGHSLNRILNYNEQKVRAGVAHCIDAVNYPAEVEDLSFSARLNRLKNLAALNENVTRNSVHISLNFDPSENFSTEKLQAIATAYMEKIGFGEQPYLVYQHLDAGHPHLHIVSVKVRPKGSRIDMQNIGKNQSEKARKELEQAFGMVPAETHKQQQNPIIVPAAAKVIYGCTETKRAIQNVLDKVVPQYRFTSIPELNAVLRQYNVAADRGSEDSRIFKHRGLVYHLLDEEGNKIGIPIKASAFYSKPTLTNLENRFSANEKARQPFKSGLKNAIDRALLSAKPASLAQLISDLKKQGINVVLRQNQDGVLYGITYVDHRNQSVFNGSSLGKSYSAKGVQERINEGISDTEKNTSQLQIDQKPGTALQLPDGQKAASFDLPMDLLEILLEKDRGSGYVPGALTGRKKKKRKSRKL